MLTDIKRLETAQRGLSLMDITRLDHQWDIIKCISIFRKDEVCQKKYDTDWRQYQRKDYIVQRCDTVVWQICSNISEKCAVSVFSVEVTSSHTPEQLTPIIMLQPFKINFVVPLHNVCVCMYIYTC